MTAVHGQSGQVSELDDCGKLTIVLLTVLQGLDRLLIQF